jgi:hypothetical protein
MSDMSNALLKAMDQRLFALVSRSNTSHLPCNDPCSDVTGLSVLGAYAGFDTVSYIIGNIIERLQKAPIHDAVSVDTVMGILRVLFGDDMLIESESSTGVYYYIRENSNAYLKSTYIYTGFSFSSENFQVSVATGLLEKKWDDDAKTFRDIKTLIELLLYHIIGFRAAAVEKVLAALRIAPTP